MIKIEAIRKFQFCAGHRVYQHESKCSNMHGHNYTLLVYATSDGLDSLGRVIDFSVLKELIDSWLQEFWDHTFLVFDKDTELLAIEPLVPKDKQWFHCPFNPTAENMAKYLLEDIIPVLLEGTGVQVLKLELSETDNCKVIVNKGE